MPVFGGAYANWQYAGEYVGDGAYIDDGSRFTISFRGGASFGFGNIKNDIGELTPLYYSNGTDLMTYLAYEQCISDPTCASTIGDYTAAGYINLGSLPATKNFESFSFAAGASIGWTVPNAPQWRIEAGYDHIAQTDFNASPFFTAKRNCLVVIMLE